MAANSADSIQSVPSENNHALQWDDLAVNPCESLLIARELNRMTAPLISLAFGLAMVESILSQAIG
jgi:hypothetical protein